MVIDASALVSLLLREERTVDALDRLAEEDPRGLLAAPELVNLESLNALRKATARGTITKDRAHKSAVSLQSLPLVTYPHGALLAEAWALRDRLTIYDASYVALADRFGDRLLTADSRLARTAADLLGDDGVIVIPER